MHTKILVFNSSVKQGLCNFTQPSFVEWNSRTLPRDPSFALHFAQTTSMRWVCLLRLHFVPSKASCPSVSKVKKVFNTCSLFWKVTPPLTTNENLNKSKEATFLSVFLVIFHRQPHIAHLNNTSYELSHQLCVSLIPETPGLLFLLGISNTEKHHSSRVSDCLNPPCCLDRCIQGCIAAEKTNSQFDKSFFSKCLLVTDRTIPVNTSHVYY